jgi:hypothetical protein
MNFFFDANISSRISKMLAALYAGEHIIIHITEHPDFLHNNNKYGNSTPDIEYIEKLSKDNKVWAVVSGCTFWENVYVMPPG